MEKILAVIMVGVGSFLAAYHYNKKIIEWLRFQSLGTRDYVVERLAMMFIEVDANRVLMLLIALSVVPAVLIFFLFYPMVTVGLPAALIFGFIGWKLPKPLVDWYYKRRVDQFVVQMVDALNLMANGMKSGLSVVQAMGTVTTELPNPIQQEFSLVMSENRLGVSLEEAFQNLARRIKSDDVEMFVTSVNILKETGGNLAETFDTITTTIRERIKVEKKIQAMTAQGFYQGMFVMAVPPIMGVVFYQSDPEFMAPLFTTTIGWAIIGVIILLEAIGFFFIMQIIKIDV
ncbi:MAG: type II secretion system F family protein [Bdellovibrionales bacterium]|nr:type II secretion system F family protein [Bdellovibrionales bacterium]